MTPPPDPAPVGRTPGALEAVVFDFDGLIIDSETPIYRSTAAALAEQGLDLTVAGWATVVGHGEEDSFRALQAAVGAEIDRTAYELAYAAQDRSWREREPALPGVVDLLTALFDAGIPVGVASSSSSGWVEGHLDRLGLRPLVGAVATSDRVDGRTKPAPDTYLLACADLGARPSRSVALEDSAPGIAAALAAGLVAVAVPSEITRHTDLGAAHHAVPDLTHLDPARLAALVDP
ncbi:MAG: HAD family phosphatase [Acidimicrobiales bacterium]|nr:HAD family phosphatase [Actinomycetota bacterium]